MDGKIRTIKENLAVALSVSDKDDGVTAENMRLLLASAASKSQSTILDDNQTLSHYDIKHDMVLHVVFQISENTWETVAVESMEVASAMAPS